ncbi:hypothetical protein E4U39_006059 [Claviceps sp. Clav50 group G5]|nr:hypothetical protein E4U39_006059 [Claviceps sp. Clav50 group G5]
MASNQDQAGPLQEQPQQPQQHALITNGPSYHQQQGEPLPRHRPEQHDMYKMLMQLMQQQLATQAALTELLHRTRVSTPRSASDNSAGTVKPQNDLPLRASDIGFFDPGVTTKKCQSLVDAESLITTYKCVLAFTQRLEHAAHSRSERAVKEVWIFCLRGQALYWHSQLITQSKRDMLREASLKTICQCLVKQFQLPPSMALDRIKSAKFTLQDCHRGENITAFSTDLLEAAMVVFQDVVTQLRVVHLAFDGQIQAVIPPPTTGMTIDKFFMQLRDREATIKALAQEKYEQAVNQRFWESAGDFSQDRNNRRFPTDRWYQNPPSFQGQRRRHQDGRNINYDRYYNGYPIGFQNRYHTPQGQAHRPSINRAVPIVNTLRQDTGYRPAVQPFYDADASDWDQDNLEYGGPQQYGRYEDQDLFDHAQEVRDDIRTLYSEEESEIPYSEVGSEVPYSELESENPYANTEFRNLYAEVEPPSSYAQVEWRNPYAEMESDIPYADAHCDGLYPDVEWDYDYQEDSYSYFGDEDAGVLDDW